MPTGRPLDLDALLAQVEGAAPSRVELDLDVLIAEVEGVAPAEGVTQRWRDRRDFYRSTQDRFDPADWRAMALAGKEGLPGGLGVRDTWQMGQAFIVRNHYAAGF